MKRISGLIMAVVFIALSASSCGAEDDATPDGDSDGVDYETSADGDIDDESGASDSDSEFSADAENSESGGCMGDIDYEAVRETDGGEAPEYADSDGDAEVDAFEDSESDDSQPDGDDDSDAAEHDVTEEAPDACPSDMVRINNYCIDRYEASRPDAGSSDAGDDESRAVSRAGVLPWYVNPMNAAHLEEFEEACLAAGKHLCTAEEWFESCNGPENSTYVWGNSFERETCNNVNTFCDDYCIGNGIPLENCNLSDNCGYSCGATSRVNCFHVAPTGSFPDCTNAYGTYDVNGNVWEVVPVATEVDSRGYMVRGGAFNCGGASDRLKCDFNAGWEALYAGFRCCKPIDEDDVEK